MSSCGCVGATAMARVYGEAMDRDSAREVLRRLHEAQGAFYAGGPDGPLREALTDDIAWHVPGDNAIAGVYEGREAVMAYLRSVRQRSTKSAATWPRGRSGCTRATC